ncbi:MAG: hypothetical protein V4508_14395 [Pseudomonadota bacterium]
MNIPAPLCAALVLACLLAGCTDKRAPLKPTVAPAAGVVALA